MFYLYVQLTEDADDMHTWRTPEKPENLQFDPYARIKMAPLYISVVALKICVRVRLQNITFTVRKYMSDVFQVYFFNKTKKLL